MYLTTICNIRRVTCSNDQQRSITRVGSSSALTEPQLHPHCSNCCSNLIQMLPVLYKDNDIRMLIQMHVV